MLRWGYLYFYCLLFFLFFFFFLTVIGFCNSRSSPNYFTLSEHYDISVYVTFTCIRTEYDSQWKSIEFQEKNYRNGLFRIRLSLCCWWSSPFLRFKFRFILLSSVLLFIAFYSIGNTHTHTQEWWVCWLFWSRFRVSWRAFSLSLHLSLTILWALLLLLLLLFLHYCCSLNYCYSVKRFV